jgi:hypothetical protein
VAEATPLPASRSRFATPETPEVAPAEEEETAPPVNRARPASRPTPALPPIKARPAAAPVRRTPRKSRTNTLQTIFYGGMALILAIGTIAGIITSVGLPLGSTGALTPTIGSTSAALAQADALLAAGQYSQAIELYNQVLTATNGSDPKALLGLAKAYYFKTPSEPDIARQYLAQVFTSTSGSHNSPEAQEALQLLSQIGLPGTATAGTPGANGTPGAAGTPGPATGGGTPGLPTAATGTTPLPPTQAAPAGAPGASTPTQ